MPARGVRPARLVFFFLGVILLFAVLAPVVLHRGAVAHALVVVRMLLVRLGMCRSGTLTPLRKFYLCCLLPLR